MTYYDITPVAKPRMTRADKFQKRKCVLQYWAYKAECRLKKMILPDMLSVTFYIEMPKSWSKKKREELETEPCRQKPDIDNLVKGLLDALLEDDAHVWNIHARKVWATKPGIRIEPQ